MPTYTNQGGSVLGSAGDDSFIYTMFPSGVTSVMALGGTDTVNVNVASSSPFGVEFSDLTGSGSLSGIVQVLAEDATLNFSEVEIVSVVGGSSDDDFYLAIGATPSAIDVTFDGGAGLDRLTLMLSAISANQTFIVNGSALTSSMGQFSNFEQFHIATGAGNDTIRTGDGDDIVRSGTGADSVSTGGGNDQVYSQSLTGNFDLGAGFDHFGGEYETGTADLSVVIGDTVTFSSGSVVTNAEGLSIAAGSGDDRFTVQTVRSASLSGGAGSDTLEYIAASPTAQRFDIGGSLNAGSYDIYGAIGELYFMAFEIADLHGGAGDDEFVLSGVFSAANVFDGEGGFDSLTFDLSARQSALSLVLNSSTGAITSNFGQFASFESFTLTGGAGADTFVTGSGSDRLTGGAGNDSLSSGGGTDWLEGGFGADTMAGGAGDDFYWADNVDDRIIENAGEGVDHVLAFTSHTLSANVENLDLEGSQAVNGIGNSLANEITGSDADNRLEGGGGADRLFGSSGDDFLAGGAGADQSSGGDGADTFFGSAAELTGDTIIDFDMYDRIVITDADLATFSYSLSGTTLTFDGGSLTLTGSHGGGLLLSAAPEGGVQLTSSNAPPPPPPVGTVNEIADFLVNRGWGTDGARSFAARQGDTITVNITALAAGGQYLAREALALWSDITGIIFVEVPTGGQIVFDDNQRGAYSDSIFSGGAITTSFVNVSTQWLVDYGTSIGSYGFQTYVHEIGHALGLAHPGYYNGTADYATEAVFANDGWPTSVMSYFDQRTSVHFLNQYYSLAYVGTPMIADVAAMQMLYGLSTITRVGDTTYGFNSTAGRDVYDATLHADIAYTIFDSGGIDTLDYSGFGTNQLIDLNSASYSNVGNMQGNVTIAAGTIVENAISGSGYDRLVGNSANNRLVGGSGGDTLTGGGGADILIGGTDGDTFQDTAAGLNGDTIADFTSADWIFISDANFATFNYSLSGSTLTYTGGTLTFGTPLSGTLVASAGGYGGVLFTLDTTPPPPPPTPAKLLLTAPGQDFDIGGTVAIVGTTSGGEEVRVVRGDIMLDASFNIGGDRVVLPGAAASYTAVLSGSFVTIAGGDISIAIPVGIAGLTVEFSDAERTLRFDAGSSQVLLGDQVVSSSSAAVAAATTPFTGDGPDNGPDSLARLILTEPGQDIDIGGNATIFGTIGADEVISMIGGTIMLDASFNSGGDTVVLPGAAGSYTAALSGSFVTIAGGNISVSIPVGIAGLSVEFADGARTLRFDSASGAVVLGQQAIGSTTQPVDAAPQSSAAMADDHAKDAGDQQFDPVEPAESYPMPAGAWELHSFYFG